MKIFIISIVAILITVSAFAQDFNFSQFYELPLLRNPALAGVFNGDLRVQSVYRNQWQAVTVPFRTGGLSAELKFPLSDSHNYLTAALQVTYDVAGDSKLTRSQLLPVISYHQNLNGDGGAFIAGALLFGMVSSQFDPTGLKWDDQFVNGQYSPTNPTQQILKATGKNYMDVGGGLSLTAPFGNETSSDDQPSYYIGVGLFHLNKPSVSFGDAVNDKTKLNWKWAFNGGLKIPTSEVTRFNLFSDYFLQGGNRQFMLGAFYTSDLVEKYEGNDGISISIGSSYRWNDALIPVLRLDYNKWSYGLSYDVNISKLKTASQFRGGFELTIGYQSIFKNRSNSLPQTKCPGIKQ